MKLMNMDAQKLSLMPETEIKATFFHTDYSAVLVHEQCLEYMLSFKLTSVRNPIAIHCMQELSNNIKYSIQAILA